ncbi:MAG: histidine kinase [Actinomycetota bacterium]|nr:histidine kinase [Actinomycetota bacterium]
MRGPPRAAVRPGVRARAAALARGLGWLANPRIVLVEALVVAIFVGNELLTGHRGTTPSGSVLDLAVEACFLMPILYAALNFGVAGSLLTGGLVSVLIAAGDIAVDLGDHRLHDAGTDLVMMLILDAVAVFVGWRMAVEQSARDRYRDLFEANAAPILLLDANGLVQEANDAARQLLDVRAQPQPPRAARPSRAAVLARPLEELFGAGAAPLLEGKVALLGAPESGARLRAVPSRLRSRRGEVQTQVVIENLTEEMRREQEAATYARHVLSAQEDERRRVAQELHDGPVQRLVHLCRTLDFVEEVEEVSRPVRDELAGARELTEVIVTELREILRGLRPPALEHLGLVPTLTRLVDEVGGRAGLVAELVVEGRPRRLDGDLELTVFRIGQEALSNVERHAKAASVRLTLSFGADALRLEVRDDGIGFVPDLLAGEWQVAHLGLRGMAERAQLVGGALRVTSAPGQGTAVEAALPARERTGVAGALGDAPTARTDGIGRARRGLGPPLPAIGARVEPSPDRRPSCRSRGTRVLHRVLARLHGPHRSGSASALSGGRWASCELGPGGR